MKNKNMQERKFSKYLLSAFLLATAIFHALFASAAANVSSPIQALASLIAAIVFGYSSYKVFRKRSVALAIFVGTLPLWLVHLVLTITDENESLFFILASGIAPTVSGLAWVLRRDKA